MANLLHHLTVRIMAMKLSMIMWFMVSAGLVFFLQTISGAPQVPCYFIFGDSLVDSGNNNHLNTSAKANYPPYGVDFPAGPTGRFTNGETIADIIGEHLGLDDYIPPFATAKGEQIIKGVNYASGSAGIRDETGSELGDNISFDEQLLNHQTIVSQVASLLGNQSAANEHLGKCLYNVVIGNNDYINNYLRPSFYNSSKLYTPDQYASALAEQYSHQLKEMFKYGARNIAVFGLGPTGCTPYEISSQKGSSPITCINWINDAVELFNDRLKLMADELNKELPAAKFVYVDSYTMQDIATIGLRILNQPCCEDVSTLGLCIPNTKACFFRDLSLFWDAVHPSRTTNTYVGLRSYLTIRTSGLLSNTHQLSPSR